jgi:4-hydroxy-tetrahydrodipicolinate reductase
MIPTIRVVQFGCGPIGCRIARLAAGRAHLQLVAGIDIDPALHGRDIGEVDGGEPLGAVIVGSWDRLPDDAAPALAIHTTGSSLRAVAPQLRALLQKGVDVVSTCEELAFPDDTNAALAAELHEQAVNAGATLLGTGINPGYLMDAWPLYMTVPCQTVRAIRVTRVQDASDRRGPFQRKIGAGLKESEFRRCAADGEIRHVGLTESARMIAAGMGWSLDDLTETIEPIMASRAIETDHVSISAGQVAGVRQQGVGVAAGRQVVTLEFRAAVGLDESYDAVSIDGVPPVEARIDGGVHGDLGTAAVVVNSVPRVAAAPPGLVTMKDLPPPLAVGA